MRKYELANPFQPNSFLFVVEGLEDFAFEIQSADLPGLTTGAITSDYKGNQGYVSGDKVTYNSASFTFVIDEHLTGYLSLVKWMQDSTRVEFEEDARKDIVVIVNTPQNTPMTELRLVNCVPVSLSGIALTTENADPITATFDVEMDELKYTAQK